MAARAKQFHLLTDDAETTSRRPAVRAARKAEAAVSAAELRKLFGAQTKPAQTKPAQTKPAQTKPAKTKPTEGKPSAQAAVAYRDMRVLYAIDVPEGDDTLYVTVALESVEGGTPQRTATTPKRALQSLPEDDDAEMDREILEVIGPRSLPLVPIPLSEDERVETLMALLLSTDRGRWASNGTPLQEGPDRQVLMERHARTGVRRPINLSPKTRIIGSDPAWYVDTATGLTGRAEIEEVAAQSFRSNPRGMPRPDRPEEKVVVIDTEPVPVLTAVSGATAVDDGADGSLNALLLSFDYAGRLVPEDDGGQFARIDGDGGPVFVRRVREEEDRAGETLREMGLSNVRITLDQGKGAPARGYAFRSRTATELWAEFVLDGAETLRRQGWRVELGENFRYRIIEVSDDWDVELLESGRDWFSLDVGIDVEGQRYPLLPILVGILERGGLRAALKDDGRVKAILDDGRILSLPAERVSKFLETLQEMLSLGRLTRDGKLALNNADAATLTDLEDIVGTRWNGGFRLRELGRRLRTVDRLEEVPPPPTFRASLRPYQQEGLDWLQFLRGNGMAGILADDMGLGKTAQTLAHIAVEKSEDRLDRPILIVVPTSLVPNWKAEAGKFVPSLRVLIMHGPDRHDRKHAMAVADVVITTYAILARDNDFLTEFDWYMVVLDEAQAIKNPLAKATRAACRLKADHRLCLSGTPIENHLGEVWSQFAFLMPGLLGTHRDFATKFRIPIEKHEDTGKRTQLARRLRPFILRRTKAEVATDLPPKTEIAQHVELATDQRDLYETIRLSMHEKVRDEIARVGLARSRIVILDALLKLRQACCDPRLVKLKSAAKVTGSGKLDTLMGMLPEMIESGRRILVFSQFTSMLDLIKRSLAPIGIPFLELRGDTTDREAPVRQFQAGECPLFLISLKAGGKGLNLTAADTVIHYDPWWNPAVEDQATDRAHRIGQQKPVFVYKLIAAGTVEERIVELQKRKGSLAGAMLHEGSWVGTMENEDLDYLFGAV